MGQIANLRLLLLGNHSLILSPIRSPLILKTTQFHHKPSYSSYSILAASSGRYNKKKQQQRYYNPNPTQRNKSTDSHKRMEEQIMGRDNTNNSNNNNNDSSSSSSSFGFNRKRAEGRDKDSRKNLQLKSRKLNPVNTICYAQVITSPSNNQLLNYFLTKSMNFMSLSQVLGTGMDTQDTSPSVLLFFDKQRFIFNAGEVCHFYFYVNNNFKSYYQIILVGVYYDFFFFFFVPGITTLLY